MPDPLIFISRYRLRPGAADTYRAVTPGWVRFWQEVNPRMLYLGFHTGADGERAATVQVHPDAASLDAQLAAINDDVVRQAKETMDFTSFEYLVLGGPSDEAAGRLPSIVVDSGVPTTVMPAVARFDRLTGSSPS